MDQSANAKSLWSLREIPLAVAVGLALYAVVIWGLVIGARVMPPHRARVVAIHEFLTMRSPDAAQADVALLGSSVAIEGVDADRVAEAFAAARADDAFNPRVLNFAWTGADAKQWLLVLPRLAELRPAAAVLCLDVAAAQLIRGLDADYAALALWSGYWPPDTRAQFRDAELLTPGELARVERWRPLALFDFRVLPPGALDAMLRETARPELRYEGYTTNFAAPWVRTTNVSDVGMQRDIANWTRSVQAFTDEQRAHASRLLSGALDLLPPTTARFIVLTPTHPELRAALGDDTVTALRTRLAALARDHDAAFLDHFDLLPAESFSDAVHPNARGRETWSRRLGADLAQQRAAWAP